MTPDDALAALMLATRNLVSTTPELGAFVGDSFEGLSYTRPTPRALAVTERLPALMAAAGPQTAELTFAVLAAAPHLAWSHSYSADEVGADYLARSGWFNLVSPEGPYATPALRVSIGYWDQGLTYPRHRHAPEEIYCVLAGSARFDSENQASVEAGPGTLVRHEPNQWHAIEMHAAPLLAIAFWKGRDLLAPSSFPNASG